MDDLNFNVEAMAKAMIAQEYKRLRTQIKAMNNTEKAYHKMRSVIQGNEYPVSLTRFDVSNEIRTARFLWGEK